MACPDGAYCASDASQVILQGMTVVAEGKSETGSGGSKLLL